MMCFEVASTVRARLRGLAGRRDYGGVLVLVPCNDVHTFTMRGQIDVAFVSGEGVVLESHRRVPPCRRLRNRGAAMVLERLACDASWVEAGDMLVMAIESRREDRSPL